jgi:hypothetical protein
VKWLVLLAACSGRAATPHVVEDARKAPAMTIPAGPYRVDDKAAHGDVQLRVEWKDVPVTARASPGRTACGTAIAGSVAPTTTWGIPDVLVMIDVDHGKALAAQPARIELETCALSPRVALASSLTVASAMDAPTQVSFGRVGAARPFAIPVKGTEAIAKLPVIGHEVELPIAMGSLLAVTYGEDTAIALSPPTPYYAITEATGQVVVRDVPVGTFAVEALLPARSGQPAHVANGTVTVTANALAEVTLQLTSP